MAIFSRTTLCRILLRDGRTNPALSICSVTKYTTSVGKNDSSEHFVEIYKLPSIQGCSGANKFKKINLWGLGTFLPFSCAAYTVGLVDLEIPLYMSLFGLTSTALSFIVGQLTFRLIGFIYISNDKQKVKISYIDFWGARKDGIYHKDDIVGLQNIAKPLDRLYKRLRISKDFYFLSLKYGNIMDSAIFKEVFKYDCSQHED